jgi:hypothetical protein
LHSSSTGIRASICRTWASACPSTPARSGSCAAGYGYAGFQKCPRNLSHFLFTFMSYVTLNKFNLEEISQNNQSRNLSGLARGSVGYTIRPRIFLLRILLKNPAKLIVQLLELGYMSMKNDKGLGVTEASGTTPKTGRGCNGHSKVRFSPRKRNPKFHFSSIVTLC